MDIPASHGVRDISAADLQEFYFWAEADPEYSPVEVCEWFDNAEDAGNNSWPIFELHGYLQKRYNPTFHRDIYVYTERGVQLYKELKLIMEV